MERFIAWEKAFFKEMRPTVKKATRWSSFDELTGEIDNDPMARELLFRLRRADHEFKRPVNDLRWTSKTPKDYANLKAKLQRRGRTYKKTADALEEHMNEVTRRQKLADEANKELSGQLRLVKPKGKGKK